MFKLFLLLNPVYVTLFWTIVLSANKARGHEPKVFLGKFMTIAFLLYLSHLFYYLPLPDVYHFADPFYQLFSLLVYPMYYIYIRLLTVDPKFSFRKHIPFLVLPFLLFLFYLVGVINMSKEEHLNYLYHKIIHENNFSGIFLYEKVIYFICRSVFILQGIIYLILSFYLVRKNRKNIRNYYANEDEDSLDKIHWLNVSLLITVIAGIILSIIGKENFFTETQKLIVPSFLFSFMLFIIGWLGSKQRPVLIWEKEGENKKLCEQQEQDKSSLNSAQLLTIKQKLLYLVEKEQIYLNKDLTIWDLARDVGTNRTYISNIINTDFKQNFSNFINMRRVEYARFLLKENPEINQQDLAEMSGFGSVQSMRRAFHTFSKDTV
ncbi:MAG: helix-turn-helix domain-containing protein [Paludibacter sp.]|nr:helix-turn-helix domain-containing protein [Paludibacter sp.]